MELLYPNIYILNCMKSKIALTEIILFLADEVIDVTGPTEGIFIKHLRPAESIDEETLDWVNPAKSNKQEIAQNSKAYAVLCDKEVTGVENKTIIRVKDPKRAISLVGNHFFVQKITHSIAQTATIEPEAEIGENVHIGANSVVGRCRIGNNVVIHNNVSINDGVIIGNDVIIKSGAAIGYDGFGYVKDDNGRWMLFPQIGGLIIRDGVEIGANCTIDKGALSDTVIGFNTKINNLCHIGHNTQIGENCIITAHVNISGSTIVGNNVWIGPNATLRGQQKIGNDVTIGMGSVVTKNIPDGETWYGSPAKKV